MTRQTETEDRTPGLIESFFRRTPQPTLPPNAPAVQPETRRGRRATRPTPQEEAAMRGWAQEWQRVHDQPQAPRPAQDRRRRSDSMPSGGPGYGWQQIDECPSGQCTPHRHALTNPGYHDGRGFAPETRGTPPIVIVTLVLVAAVLLWAVVTAL